MSNIEHYIFYYDIFRTGSNLSENSKSSSSENGPPRRPSPRPYEHQSHHFQAALFRGGSHWSAVSSTAPAGDQEYEEGYQTLDQTITQSTNSGDHETELAEEGSTSIDAEVTQVTIVKV